MIFFLDSNIMEKNWMKYTIEKHSKVSFLDGFAKFWMRNMQKNCNITLYDCTWVGSNWTVTKIVVICGNDWYKAKGVDLLTLASYCVLMDIPIPVYVAISWQKNHTTVALDVLNKRSATSHLFFSTSTPCITWISLTRISLIKTNLYKTLPNAVNNIPGFKTL